MAYDLNATTAYIREAARRRGIDPDIAVRVARSEGLARGTWQSNLSKGGRREPSYGPFQFLVGGEGTGYPTGMGNDFKRDTGLDPSDPRNVNATIDYAMDRAAKDGWSAWYGAGKVGIGRRDGIGGAKPVGPGANPAGGSPLVDAVASRGQGAGSVVGAAGSDTVGTSSSRPMVDIGLPSERQSKSAEAMIKAGYDLGGNAKNGFDALGGLAQVLAGNIAAKRAETGEQSALRKAIAGLDPEYAMAAQLLGGREGAAQAILSQQQNRTAKANRDEDRAFRQDQITYQRSQDELDNARADKTLELQTAKANAAPDAPSSVREYEYAKSQGYTGSYQEWEQANRKAGATVVNTGQDEGEFQKKAAGRMVERFGGIADGQSGAANTVQTIPVLRELLTQAPTGPVAGRLAERFPGFSTAGDAFTATVNQIAPTLRIPGSGAMSDRDMDILMGSFPKLSSDPAANGLIMDVFEKKAQINLQRADIANQALRGEIEPGEADRRLSEIDRTPLFDDAMRARLTGQPPEQSDSIVPGSDRSGQRWDGGVPVGGQGGTAPIRRATNKQTGQVLELRNGQWVPVQ